MNDETDALVDRRLHLQRGLLGAALAVEWDDDKIAAQCPSKRIQSLEFVLERPQGRGTRAGKRAGVGLDESHLEGIGGVLGDESGELLRAFFRARRE